MLNRRHIRLKIMQLIYALKISDFEYDGKTEDHLLKSLEDIYDLYLILISILIEIQKGYSSSQISELLEGEELIINNFLFNFYTRIISNDKSIKAGEYLIDRSESIYTLIFKLTEGDNFQRKIILLPGSTLQEIYSLRQQRGIVDDLGINPAIYLNEMSIPFTEGVFFPDTFFFEKGDQFSSILKKSILPL